MPKVMRCVLLRTLLTAGAEEKVREAAWLATRRYTQF